MDPVAAIIFDLDDTLFPEREYAFSGFRAVAKAFSHVLGEVEPVAARMRELFDTEYRRHVFNQILAERALDDSSLVRQMIDVYRSHHPTIQLFPDAQRALRRLRGSKRIGLITDGSAIMQRAKIQALKLVEAASPTRSAGIAAASDEHILDVIVVTDERGAEYAKPNPRAFELVSERLGLPPRSCVYVADNPAKDFIAPNALGWLTVRVLRPDSVYANAVTPPHGKPRWVIENLDELDATLTKGRS